MNSSEATKTAKKGTVPRIERTWCKGCGVCVHFCPKQVLELDDQGKARVVRPAECIGCRMCEMRCPDLAVEVIETQGDQEQRDE